MLERRRGETAAFGARLARRTMRTRPRTVDRRRVRRAGGRRDGDRSGARDRRAAAGRATRVRAARRGGYTHEEIAGDDRARGGHAARAAASGATTVDQGTELMNEHTSSDDRLDELTAALPREIAPPPELWAAIRAELAPRSAHAWRWDALASRRGGAADCGQLVARSRCRGAAGARACAARRSRRRRAAPVVACARRRRGAAAGAARVGGARATCAAREALRRTLDERRDSLAPSTVATVERSLRIADSAIAEARAALERDPANACSRALFVSNYERKIDLLRRATELAPRT